MEASSSAHHWPRNLQALALKPRIISAQRVEPYRSGGCRRQKRRQRRGSDRLEDATSELGTLARLTLQRAQGQWRELDDHLACCDERVAVHGQSNAAVKAVATLSGIGPVTASAVSLQQSVSDVKQFENGAQFGAWVGFTPRQRSNGGKNNLSGITKRGDTYPRTVPIQGANSGVTFIRNDSTCEVPGLFVPS